MGIIDGGIQVKIDQKFGVCFGIAFILLIMCAGLGTADTIYVNETAYACSGLDNISGVDQPELFESTTSASYFVGSKNSDVYHYPSCYYVDNILSANLIYFNTPESAINSGYRPCKYCNPPTTSSSSSETTIIQDAIDIANNGDTIIISSGTYTENVNVYKELTIISESGNPADTIIQAADPNDHLFHVTADNVTISGFTIIDAAGSSYYANLYMGLLLEEVNYCNITNNKLSNNNVGIFLSSSSNNTLINNNASNNDYGIWLWDSNKNNTLRDNIVNSNDGSGIRLEDFSNNNKLINNTANSNNHIGIYLYSSSNNAMTNNTASNNDNGIWLDYSSNSNTLINNIMCNNGQYGIQLIDASSNNTIYNNFFSNTENSLVSIDSIGNVWNITKAPGSNIVGGTYLGGNYWAMPDGAGFSQTRADLNRDGICDSSHTINEYNIDYLPLSMSFDPMIYDFNDNGLIEKNEVMESIKDYFSNKITKTDVMEVIIVYFSS